MQQLYFLFLSIIFLTQLNHLIFAMDKKTFKTELEQRLANSIKQRPRTSSLPPQACTLEDAIATTQNTLNLFIKSENEEEQQKLINQLQKELEMCKQLSSSSNRIDIKKIEAIIQELSSFSLKSDSKKTAKPENNVLHHFQVFFKKKKIRKSNSEH